MVLVLTSCTQTATKTTSRTTSPTTTMATNTTAATTAYPEPPQYGGTLTLLLAANITTFDECAAGMPLKSMDRDTTYGGRGLKTTLVNLVTDMTAHMNMQSTSGLTRR
jgi:hypothetical protein